MESPEPDKPTNWVPTRKNVGGSIIGTAAAQVIIAICDRAFHTPLGPELGGAITTLCVATAAYFIPNAN